MTTQVVAILLRDTDTPVLIGYGAEGVLSLAVEADSDASTTDMAVGCQLAAKQAGWALGQPVLALPTRMCLAASIRADGLHRTGRAAGMLYRLEEFLPVDAELVTADFVSGGNQALGVAVLTDQVKHLVEAFEGEGITFCAIVPASMLALQTALAGEASVGLVLLLANDRYDAFELDDGRPVCWTQGPTTPQSLEGLLTSHRRDEDTTRLWVAADNESAFNLLTSCWDTAAVDRNPVAPITLIGESAHQIARHGHAPLVDLQRGALAAKDRLERVRAPFWCAAAALMLLLTTVCVCNLWRSQQLTAVMIASQNLQQDMYREAFPGQNVPPAVLSRLRSEQRRLAGMSGQSDQLPAWGSSLSLMQQVLASLPDDLRYRILELRLDLSEVYVDGQARSHGDADKIAAKLRSTGGFTVDPPRTENLADQGVAFTLIGRSEPKYLAEAPGK